MRVAHKLVELICTDPCSRDASQANKLAKINNLGQCIHIYIRILYLHTSIVLLLVWSKAVEGIIMINDVDIFNTNM